MLTNKPLFLLAAISSFASADGGLRILAGAKGPTDNAPCPADTADLVELGEDMLATFWDRIVDGDCDEKKAVSAYNRFFDNDISVTLFGALFDPGTGCGTTITDRNDLLDCFLDVILGACEAGVDLEWVGDCAIPQGDGSFLWIGAENGDYRAYTISCNSLKITNIEVADAGVTCPGED